MIFWILKEVLEDYLSWKNQPQSLSRSPYLSTLVFAVFEWSKMDSFQFFVKNVEIQIENGCQIRKALSFSDLPAKFHAWERLRSFKKVFWVTLIDAFLAVFWMIHGFVKKSSNETYAFYHFCEILIKKKNLGRARSLVTNFSQTSRLACMKIHIYSRLVTRGKPSTIVYRAGWLVEPFVWPALTHWTRSTNVC